MADIIQNPTLSKLRSLFLLSLKTFVGFVEEEEKRGRKEILHIYKCCAAAVFQDIDVTLRFKNDFTPIVVVLIQWGYEHFCTQVYIE